MAGWTKLTDMELDDEDQVDSAIPSIPEKPRFPWGLRICLTEKELEKLGLDCDCEIGDVIDMRCFGEVTSVSKNDGPDGPHYRVEIQIQRMALENEATEEPGE